MFPLPVNLNPVWFLCTTCYSITFDYICQPSSEHHCKLYRSRVQDDERPTCTLLLEHLYRSRMLTGWCESSSNPTLYSIYTGAFRCLVEGCGVIAFLKHTTVGENVDGRRKKFWACNQLNADYQLVCHDGTRASMTDYESCNFGKVWSNAIVTRGRDLYNATEVNAYTNLLLYAQQHFRRDSEDEWKRQLLVCVFSVRQLFETLPSSVEECFISLFFVHI
ncbi:hypothetical protein Pcinc_019261 [Petrolisthes cinctipes]|uniref:Transferrin-like domain-containing protein n=1 Tax=Petrolisthes cinctipes TaxID=88211 RepID=A0AAE1FL83_PETCI|nr:hypothetical protein Pcinc_019261 [Petrolisthes cinctipes]